MTTPRVTVPVEPEGVSPVYTAAYDSIRKGAPGLSDATCAVIARSINMKVSRLSAAPAPEGGAVWFGVTGAADETEALAVALFDARCPGVRMTDEDLHYYRAAAQRAMQAVADELDTPALATREEAPAEAGE